MDMRIRMTNIMKMGLDQDILIGSLIILKTIKKRREENFGVTRSITVGRVFDSRDNIYDPHEGKRIGYSVEWAGLGGDFDFTKFTGDWRYYYRAGGENVWALNLGAGWADGRYAFEPALLDGRQ